MDDDGGTELRESISALVRRLRAEKTNGELGETSRSVLRLLSQGGPRTLRELSEHQRVTPPAMNQTINGLEASGLISRESDPTDGRKVQISATPMGVERSREYQRRGHEWLNSRLASLTPDERRTIRDAAALFRRMSNE